MSLHCRDIKVLAIVLLVVQLCLPISGPVYISEYMNTGEASHSGLVCVHTDADTDHESQGGHEQITHCHELDAPCDTASGPVIKHVSVVSPLTASYAGALLPGYGAPREIPPKNRV